VPPIETPITSWFPHPRCDRCSLCELKNQGTNKSVGIPTRLFITSTSGVSDQCVLIVGEAPGHEEDLQGAPFVGPSGERLDTDYAYPLAHAGADVYVSNIVRCRPFNNSVPSVGQRRTCVEYLLNDLRVLSHAYRRVALLCVGATSLGELAPKDTSGGGRGKTRTLTDQLSHQCQPFDYALGNIWLWATYHPAACLRDPRKGKPVEGHISTLMEWLKTGEVRRESAPPVTPHPDVRDDIPLLAFDLETYGCLKDGPDQRVFHPVKMYQRDGVSNPIITAHVAYRDNEGAHCHHYVWGRIDKYNFFDILSRAEELCGQNLQFDIKLVRDALAESNRVPNDVLPPFKTRLRELLVETFLYDDLLPERSLKAVAWLFRTGTYDDFSKPVKCYDGPLDPKLVLYGAEDAHATLCSHEAMEQLLHDRYGRHPVASSKCDEYRRRWWSDAVWCAILMEEAGVCFDTSKLSSLHTELEDQHDALVWEARDRLDLIIQGEGSNKDKRALITCAMAKVPPDVGDQVPKTKTGEFSFDKDTRNLLLGALDPSTEEAQSLSIINEASEVNKLLTTYTGPLLWGKRSSQPVWDYKEVPTVTKGAKNPTRKVKIPGTSRYEYDDRHALIPLRDNVAIAYPSYFLTPKERDEKGREGGAGGTSRWSAKDPAIQTLPKRIFSCMCSRHEGGHILCADYAQLEWRMMMWLSGDERGLQEINEGRDIHSESAAFLLGLTELSPYDVTSWLHSRGLHDLRVCPDSAMRAHIKSGSLDLTYVTKWLRQWVGKSPNFEEAYGGGAETLQKTVRVKAGIEIPMTICDSFIKDRRTRYPQREAWRQEWLSRACKDGAVHLLLLGQSRSFATYSYDELRSLFREKVLNMEVQSTGFNILVSSIVEVQKLILARKMITQVVAQVHDSMVLDVAPQESEDVKELVRSRMLDNEYLHKLEDITNHGPCPLGVDITILNEES